KPGNIMLINDMVSLFVPSPLIGENTNEIGERFPDMTYVFDEEIQEKVRKVAKEKGVDVKEGIYCQLKGPHFETKMDIKVLRQLGVTSVAMSLGIEAIAAHHMGMKVCGLSMIVNYAAGMLDEKISHEDIMQMTKKASKDVLILLENLIKEI
ncbi:MAG: purine-nucleoside phosphorylase, partial [Lachnospiraceae bacterium]|nr:purine-nucleoside phosphorylase [Lachnospiraceae bacterium]